MGSLAGWFDLSREFHGPSVAQLELLGLTFCNNPALLPSCPPVRQYQSVSQPGLECRNEWWYCRGGAEGDGLCQMSVGDLKLCHQTWCCSQSPLAVGEGRGGQTSVSRITIISQYDTDTVTLTVSIRQGQHNRLTFNKQTNIPACASTMTIS